MNEFIPIHPNDRYDPLNELSVSKFSLFPSPILLLVIPAAFFLFSKKHSTPKLDTTYTEVPVTPPISSGMNSNPLDKASQLLSGFKKASTLNDLRKNLSNSEDGVTKGNLDAIKEVLNVFSNDAQGTSKLNMDKISNVLSLVGKIKDIKKVLDIKKALSSDATDLPGKIDNIIDAVAPILPKSTVKNIDQFKKMAQMISLMSMMNDDDDEDEKNEKDASQNESTVVSSNNAPSDENAQNTTLEEDMDKKPTPSENSKENEIPIEDSESNNQKDS